MKMIIIIITCAVVSAGAQTVIVAAAANLQPVGPALIAAFAAARPGMRAEFRYGSTGSLAAQIRQGSPDEILLAADMAAPAALGAEGRTVGPVQAYARGRLVLFMRKGIPAGNGSAWTRGFAALGTDAVRSIAVADPKTAPYGAAAARAIANVGAETALGPKIVYAGNISQAAQYAIDATDAAFIAASSLGSEAFRPFKEGLAWCYVDPSLHEPILQGMAVLGAGPPTTAAKAFAEFMLSPEATSILESAGYGKP